MSTDRQPGVTAAIIARDEAGLIADCLDSLAWADARLVILDPRTTDDTASVASALGARVVSHEFTTFPVQRNFALDQVDTEWVFFVDADERASTELAAEIRECISIQAAGAPVGYWVPRRNIIWGRWIRHGGWYPDHQLRLLRVANARYDEGREVHELVRLAGPAGYLTRTLTHLNYRTIGQFIAKQQAYSTLDARTLYRQGIRPKPQNYVLQPVREFRRRYIDNAGYRDGLHGLLLALLLAWFNAVMYTKLTRLVLADLPWVAAFVRQSGD